LASSTEHFEGANTVANDDITKTSHFVDEGQMRIQELPGAIPAGETALPILANEVAFIDQARSDRSMLMESNTNREESENFIATRGLIGRWNLAEIMLRAWVEPVKWKGSEQFRSHLGIPLVAEQFYSIHSVVNQTLLGGYRIFRVDPTSGTDLQCAEAQEAILNAELKTCGYKGVSLKTEMREVTYDGLFYGFGVAQYGWEKVKRNIIKKVHKCHTKTVVVDGNSVSIPEDDDDEDAVEDKVIAVVEENRPKFEHVPIRRFRYAPDLRRGDPRVAEWGGRVIYASAYDLDALRGKPGWNIPTREQLVKLTTPQLQDQAQSNPMDTLGSNTGNPVFQQSTTPQKAYPENYSDRTQHDPLARKFELFEYWTAYRHCISLAKEYILLNETHEFKRPPFLGFNFRSAPDSAHGYGIAFWLTDFQRICQGIINAFMDDVNLNLMGTYTSPAGLNNTSQAQWIFPGKVFKSDPSGKVEALARNAVNAQEPLAIIAQIKAWASSISGAGIGTLGANPGAAGDVRTPGGVEALQSGENIKLQDLVDVISEQVLVPFLEFCIEQNQKLKPSQLRALLSQQLGDAFKTMPLDIINGTYRVEISAGSKLAAREAVNKFMGIIQTFLQAPGTMEHLAQQAMKIDYNNLFSSLFDSYGAPYRDQIIIPMTEEDKQRALADTQLAAAQGKLNQLKVQGDIKKDVDNNQAENRLLIETGKHTLKEQGKTTDLTHDMILQKQDAANEKALASTPEQQGLDRAAKGAFAKMDADAF
jgi:hypothetical protein